MGIESRVIKVLKRIGGRRDQAVLDFGCSYGAYTVPLTKIVRYQGKMYALDKDI